MKREKGERSAAHQQNRKITRSSTIISLLGVALFLGSGVAIYKLTPPPYEKNLADPISQLKPTISLSLLQRTAENSWKALEKAPEAGEQVAFQLSTTHPLHASLLYEPNHTRPRTLFDDIRIPPGENRVINFNNADYHYTVKKQDEHAVFCLVATIDTAALTEKLVAVRTEKHLDNLPAEHCVSW